MHQILICESSDLSRDATSLAQALNFGGLQTTAVQDHSEILMHLRQTHYSALIIDADTLLNEIPPLVRTVCHEHPFLHIVVFKTAWTEEEKIAAYHNGVDRCFSKPMSTIELAAALHSLIRRTQMNRAERDATRLILDMQHDTLQGPLYMSKLTHAEAYLLSQFHTAPNQTLSYQQLIDLLNVTGDNPSSKAALEVRIVRLRQKLDEVCGEQQTLKTLRGLGYQLRIRLHLVLSEIDRGIHPTLHG
jgi:DNA-binding response OmpR family regulator